MEAADDIHQEDRWSIIRRKMEGKAATLRRQGSIVSRMARSRRVWALRFRECDGGKQKQRAIYIGGDDQPELLRRARKLLKNYQEQTHWPKEIAHYAKVAAAIDAVTRRFTGR